MCGGGSICVISVLFPHFHCEPKTALKKFSLALKQVGRSEGKKGGEE